MTPTSTTAFTPASFIESLSSMYVHVSPTSYILLYGPVLNTPHYLASSPSLLIGEEGLGTRLLTTLITETSSCSSSASVPIAAELATSVDTKLLEYAASNEALCSGVKTVFLCRLLIARASSEGVLVILRRFKISPSIY